MIFALHTLRSTFYTPRSTLHALHSTLYTPHSTLTPHTLHPTLCTLHSALYTLPFTLYVHCALYTPHSTLYSPLSTLYLCTFTLYTLHFTLHPHNFTLFTLYAVWNLGLASFSCCARTPTSRPQLPFCTALLLPALPKVDSDAEGGPLNLPQSLVMLTMLNFLIPFVQHGFIVVQHAPASDLLVHVDGKAAQLRCAFCSCEAPCLFRPWACLIHILASSAARQNPQPVAVAKTKPMI